MTVFITYCSAAKSKMPAVLPAIERYESQRIEAVFSAAKPLQLDFMILSGRYGLLAPADPLPYYDHLLLPSEVPDHVDKVAGQLQQQDITDVVFFSAPVSEDPNVQPYIDCMKYACERVGAIFSFVEIGICD